MSVLTVHEKDGISNNR